MPTKHLINSLAAIATGQAPVIVQVHNGRGLDLAAVAVGALLTLGVLLAIAGARLLLRRQTNINRIRRPR